MAILIIINDTDRRGCKGIEAFEEKFNLQHYRSMGCDVRARYHRFAKRDYIEVISHNGDRRELGINDYQSLHTLICNLSGIDHAAV